jgi:hypothetical protein
VASRVPVNPAREIFLLVSLARISASFAGTWVTPPLSCLSRPRPILPGVAVEPSVLRNSHPCGEEGTRTPDLLLAKQALFQLSYSPDRVPPTVCAYLDSNQGPQLYQSCALAN